MPIVFFPRVPLAWVAVPGPWLAVGGLLMLGILIGLAVLAKRRPAQPFPSLWRRLQSENGSATVEFALVTPVLLFFVMSLIQVALLLVGFQHVQHAAFRAARTAIVQIPRDLSNETLNQINAGADDGKFGQIKLAAQYALVPVAGELDGASWQAGTALADGMRQYLSSAGAAVPGWVDTLLAARMAYAAQKTRVSLLQASDGRGVDPAGFTDLPKISGLFTYGPKDPVAVEVEHDMNLSVPYVRALFQDGAQATRAGPGAFATIKARAILVNEGIDPRLQEAPFPRED